MKQRRTILQLAMVVGMMLLMSITAMAWDGDPYAGLVNTTTTVKFNNIGWYVIADNSTAVDAGTVTLLAKDPIGASKFHDSRNVYSSSTVKGYLDELITGTGSFAVVADAIASTDLNDVNVRGAKLWLISKDEANRIPEAIRKCSQTGGADKSIWWLRTPGDDSSVEACVYNEGSVYSFGLPVQGLLEVRPALRLNLAKIVFLPESKTFLARQTISAEDVTTTYGDTDKSIHAKVTGGVKIRYAVKEGSGNYIEVNETTGVLTIKQVPTDGKAYVIVTAEKTAVSVQETKEVTVKICKADSVPAKVYANNRNYDGTTKPLLTVRGISIGGEMRYARGNAFFPPTYGEFSKLIPEAKDPGTYHVWYKVIGDINHMDTEPSHIVVVISQNYSDATSPAPDPTTPTTPTKTAEPTPEPTVTQEPITILKAPAGVKAKAKKNKVTVSWKKIKKTQKTKALRAQIKSIQVQYATDPSFTQNVGTKTVGKNKTKAVLKLQRKTTYYVRVRYVGADGVSAWSKVKRVKTK